jgi:hypothetical protein
MAILKKKGMPKAKEYKKFLRGMRAATSSKFPADSFMERRMKLGSAKLLAHNKYKLEQPKSALKEVGKKAGRFLPKKVVAVATAIGAGVAALKAKKKKEAKKKMGGGMMKKYTKGGIPGYDTGTWITKKEKPTAWITRKEKPTSWITKKEKPTAWITKKKKADSEAGETEHMRTKKQWWIKKKSKGGIPGYNTGKGIELAKKHKKTLKDKIATGIGYAGEMGKSIPSPGNPYFIKDQAKKIIEKIKKKRLEKSIKQKQQATREITDIFSGGRKGKPHSSPEGRKASAGRTIRRMIANRKKFMRPNWTTSRNPRALNVGGSVTVKTKIGKYFPTKTY